MSFIEKNHDLTLPNWGPYSKKYAGVAHVANSKRGLRFDVSVLPGNYRRQMLVPNEKWASAHHAWEASPYLEYYSYRYEIEWKDKVYCDVSISEAGEDKRLIRAEYVNNTEDVQNLMLHLAANLNFPALPGQPDVELKMAKVALPNYAVWIDAIDYTDLQFSVPQMKDINTEDGLLRGEVRVHGVVGGSAIGGGFGSEEGDTVTYDVELEHPLENATLVVRYASKNCNGKFSLSGCSKGQIDLPNSNGKFVTTEFRLGDLPAGNSSLTLCSTGEGAVELDGLVVCEEHSLNEVVFEEAIRQHKPEIEQITENAVILKYQDSDYYYALAWRHDNSWVREIFSNELDSTLRLYVPNNYSSLLVPYNYEGITDEGVEDLGHFTNAFMRPVGVQPNSSKIVYSQVSCGCKDQVRQDIQEFLAAEDVSLERIYKTARAKRVQPKVMAAGETYRFSQERMAATELLNIVYPVYTRKQYIRHNTPGKWWDSLYTWDSGFMGMALLEYDVKRSVDNLNTYLVPEGDTHCAWVAHGSPIPTQFFQFQEIWNKTSDPEFLEQVYGSLKHYYLFLAGHTVGSNTTNMKSDILRTWDVYRWDSGGWDDYPAQIHTIHNELFDTVTPTANTAYIIRGAKILAMAAKHLGRNADVALFNQDIERFTNALQTHAWDDEVGYFSYVTHDKEGNPTGPLRYSDGTNYNMGLDGIMPLMAGVCSLEQQSLFLKRLQSQENFWTDIGITSVDKSAPYYKADGYWNGAVWMPHQWFFWKTALDLGEVELAHKVANTALNLWKKEVETSYYCFEHFIVESQRGAGWHQFGGLSSPVVSWYSAYYKLGKLSTGFDTWVKTQSISEDYSYLEAELELNVRSNGSVLLVNLKQGVEYAATFEGYELNVEVLESGTLQITLPQDVAQGQLIIQQRQ
ncbi:MGH1-like glycoside hydrolase domain-containing protein [Vibrio owensii]|uniref:MGH1-like glycoside hydrolase domain-containing protein n=1 Tax=Vibrio owensii TaxID=696485 RepID=UPI00406845E8